MIIEDYKQIKENIFSMPDALKKIIALTEKIPTIEERLVKQEQLIADLTMRMEKLAERQEQIVETNQRQLKEEIASSKNELLKSTEAIAKKQKENRDYVEKGLSSMDNAARLIMLATVMSEVDDAVN